MSTQGTWLINPYTISLDIVSVYIRHLATQLVSIYAPLAFLSLVSQSLYVYVVCMYEYIYLCIHMNHSYMLTDMVICDN